MARTKRTNAKANSQVTASAHRTQASSSPAAEDPPLQESRRPCSSPAARINRRAADQNDDNAQDDEPDDKIDEEAAFRARILADAGAVSTTADATERIKVVKAVIKGLKDNPMINNTEMHFERAEYELAVFRGRRRDLRAAGTAPSAANNPGHVSKGKGKTTAQSLSGPRSGRPAASALASGPEGEDEPEEETQQPPTRRNPRNLSRRNAGQASQSASDNQKPASLNPDGDPRSEHKTTTQMWAHEPMKLWEIHGIVKESMSHYKVAWKGTTKEKGQRVGWTDFWVPKSYVTEKAKQDWNLRKHDEALWEVFDDSSQEDEAE